MHNSEQSSWKAGTSRGRSLAEPIPEPLLSGKTEQPLQVGLETRKQLQEVKVKQVFCAASTSSDCQQKRKTVKYVTMGDTEVLDMLITLGR